MRIQIPQYAMELALVAAKRSEDPYLQVGAVALTPENRVIATAYNGLPPGYEASEKFWKDRNARLIFMIHAEQNLCSLFRRNEAKIVAVTHMPCATCLMMLLAHGVHEVLWRHEYQRDERALQIAEKYGITLTQV